MSTTPTVIANLALDAIGWTEVITSIDDTTSNAAIVCKRQYTLSKEEMLEEYRWRFAEKSAALASVPTATYDPTADATLTKYAYAYYIPSDCLIINEIFNPNSDTEKIDFTLQMNELNNETYILTNEDDAVLKYTGATDSFTVMKSALFRRALSHKLAANIAMPLTKDKQKRDDNLNSAFGISKMAQTKDAKEGKNTAPRTTYKDSMNVSTV